MGPADPVWVVPGQPWFNQVNACRRLLLERIGEQAPLPIADLIKILPLNPTDNTTLDELSERGNLDFKNGEVTNTAQAATRASFLDDNVGAVRLIVPAAVDAKINLTETSLEFIAGKGIILLVLPDLPAQYPFSGNFELRRLKLTEDFVLYTMQDQIEPRGIFEIKVDLRLPMTPLVALAALRAMPAHRQRKVRAAIRLLSSEEDSCFGSDDGSASWFITRDMMGLCRIQHGNEHTLGNKVFGPDTLVNCQKRLAEMQEQGTCA